MYIFIVMVQSNASRALDAIMCCIEIFHGTIFGTLWAVVV
jgi:hypothetical protein